MNNPSYTKQLDLSRFDEIKPSCIEFIKTYLRKGDRWTRAYSLKQAMSSRIAYCYQADMYELCRLAGFQVKVDGQGDHWVKACYRKKQSPSPSPWNQAEYERHRTS